MLLDYETLRLIWWVLLGVLLIGFAIMGGFDLGVGMLLPFVARNDVERRITINTIGPTWEGNQVWLVLGGGAIFAAWPILYAVAFSGFYMAMLLVLLALILRPVGFKYRSKLPNRNWRYTWDIMLFIGGFVPTLIFGVAVGNVIQGVPFHFDNSLRVFYTGSFWELLNPFALLCGVVSVSMLGMHGGLFLATKTDGQIRERATTSARIFSLCLIALFILAGIWLAFGIDGYQLLKHIAHDGPSNPLYKQMVKVTGGWMHNYGIHPILWGMPLLAIIGAFLAYLTAREGSSKFAFINSAISVFCVIATVGLTMFPVILPSSTDPGHSLLVWDASSSQLTLMIMLVATIIFLPLILLYTAWVYRVLKGRITVAHVDKKSWC